MVKTLIVGFFFCVPSVLYAGGEACSDAPAIPGLSWVQLEMAHANYVFWGELVYAERIYYDGDNCPSKDPSECKLAKLNVIDPDGRNRHANASPRNLITRFRVQQAYKGDVENMPDLRFPFYAGGMTAEIGEMYLIFANSAGQIIDCPSRQSFGTKEDKPVMDELGRVSRGH